MQLALREMPTVFGKHNDFSGQAGTGVGISEVFPNP